VRKIIAYLEEPADSGIERSHLLQIFELPDDSQCSPETRVLDADLDNELDLTR
jgi:hypothetical protein